MLPGVTKRHIEAILEELSETMPVRRATLLWFVADLRKLSARYADAESLLWRDSGALGATLSLSAAALGYLIIEGHSIQIKRLDGESVRLAR